MNISDFANSFDLQLSDLESVGDLGYVEGITKLIVDKLNSMATYKRPIHCNDAKREILYVKDNDKWEREEQNNPKLRNAIKTIYSHNVYTDSKDCDSHENENKIIRRIAKEIIIKKYFN
jgi:hypothetical protein